MKELMKLKLGQAQDALEEAESLLYEGGELRYVINNLYYAFLYPVLGLLQTRRIQAPTHNDAISLFEREFVQIGEFDERYMDAMRHAFRLRPLCAACEGRGEVTRDDILQILPVAAGFLEQVKGAVQ